MPQDGSHPSGTSRYSHFVRYSTTGSPDEIMPVRVKQFKINSSLGKISAHLGGQLSFGGTGMHRDCPYVNGQKTTGQPSAQGRQIRREFAPHPTLSPTGRGTVGRWVVGGGGFGELNVGYKRHFYLLARPIQYRFNYFLENYGQILKRLETNVPRDSQAKTANQYAAMARPSQRAGWGVLRSRVGDGGYYTEQLFYCQGIDLTPTPGASRNLRSPRSPLSGTSRYVAPKAPLLDHQERSFYCPSFCLEWI